MNFKRFLLIPLSLLFVLCCLFLTGCPDTSSTTSNSAKTNGTSTVDNVGSAQSLFEEYDSDIYDRDDSTSNSSGSDGEKSNEESSTLSQDKIIYSSEYSLETSDYDTAHDKLEAVVRDTGSILETNNTGIYSNIRTATINVMVPRDKYDSFKESVSNICKVVSFSESASNISKTYSDTEKRLKVAEERATKIYDLIERYEASTTNISGLTSLYNELDDAQRSVEQIKTNLLNMDVDLKYCDVSITLKDTHRYDDSGDLQGDGSWISDRLYDIHNSTKMFRQFLTMLVVAIIYMLPYAIMFLILFSIFARWPEKMWDRLGRKPKVKKEKKQRKQQPQQMQMPPMSYYQQSVVQQPQQTNKSGEAEKEEVGDKE